MGALDFGADVGDRHPLAVKKVLAPGAVVGESVGAFVGAAALQVEAPGIEPGSARLPIKLLSRT